MLQLKEKPTLKDIQRYVAELEKERGFDHDTILQKCLLLGEEVGELFKAVRKLEKIGIDKNSEVTHVEDELADILIILATIANRSGIDLEVAFRKKEEINKKRAWE